MCMRDGISQDVPLGLGYPRMSQDIPDVLGHLGLGHVYERWDIPGSYISQDVPGHLSQMYWDVPGLLGRMGYPRMSHKHWDRT